MGGYSSLLGRTASWEWVAVILRGCGGWQRPLARGTCSGVGSRLKDPVQILLVEQICLDGREGLCLVQAVVEEEIGNPEILQRLELVIGRVVD